MRLLIASDIHGSATAAEALLKRINEFEPERIALLGDILYHGPRNGLPASYDPKAVIAALNPLASCITCVRGNCDAEVDQMVLDFDCRADWCSLEVDGLRLCLTHGHLYETGALPPDCGSADVLLSGHTHVKVLERDKNGLVLLNPGSPTFPKDGTASYATYEDGIFALRALDGTVLSKLQL